MASCMGSECDGAGFHQWATYTELTGLDLEVEAGLGGLGLTQHERTFQKAQQAHSRTPLQLLFCYVWFF